MLERTNYIFDIDPIIEQVSNLKFEKRLSLNYTEGKLLNGPYIVKPEFENTPLGNVLKTLGNIGEARLMKLELGTSYTAHCDPDDRLHLAIVTNPSSYLIDLDDEKLYHLPADGTVWKMDTGKTHVAANFGVYTRIHLNIRVLLPAYSNPGYLLEFDHDMYEWKQESYTILMKFFNRAVKEGKITGFEKVTDKSVLINLSDPVLMDPYISSLKEKGFSVNFTKL